MTALERGPQPEDISGPHDPAPLSKINVLDLSWVAAGPLCGVLLSYFGATVVRVESAYRLDTARSSPPRMRGEPGINKSGYFGALNLGKYSVCLNLNNPSGLAIAHRLVEWADVVIQAFRPGMTKKWAMDYESLSARKPGIIVLSLSLQGQTGPLAGLRGMGFQVHGMSGMASLIGWPDRAPSGFTHAYPDYVVPLPAVAATIAALDHRDRTGEGQEIDVAQMEVMLNAAGAAVATAAAGLPEVSRSGNRLLAGSQVRAAPHGAYPVCGDDRWIAISVFTGGQWQALCSVLGNPVMETDPRFQTFASRARFLDELDRHLSRLTAEWDGRELMERLQAAGVPAGVVLDQQGLFEDPQLQARGHFVPINHPEWGTYPAETFGARPSLTPPTIQRPAPCLGEHNELVIRQFAGLSEPEYAQAIVEGGVEFYGAD